GTLTKRSTRIALLLAILAAGGNGVSMFAQSPKQGTQLNLDLPAGPIVRWPDATLQPSAQPAIQPAKDAFEQRGIDWGHLAVQSFVFLSVENAFRCATEEGTRDGISGPFFHNYVNAVGNLHGWNDGDPFYVNYIGHPMQGAVSSDIWLHNDRAYR